MFGFAVPRLYQTTTSAGIILDASAHTNVRTPRGPTSVAAQLASN